MRSQCLSWHNLLGGVWSGQPCRPELCCVVVGEAQKPFSHPIPRTKRAYMVFIFCLTASLLFADQNLMAPNLTDIAHDFGFSDHQRDALLGGVIGSCFFVVGAPTALLTGWLSHSYNRRNLLFLVVILGRRFAKTTLHAAANLGSSGSAARYDT